MRYKLLLITDHFPPEQSGGVGRSFSLYKYLPEFDFDVFVITKNSYGSLTSEHNVFRSDSYTDWKEGKFLSIKSISKILLTPFYRYLFVYSDIWWRFKALKAAEKLISDYSFDLIYASFPSVDNFKIGLQLNEKYGIPLICEFRDGLVFESIIYPANFIQKRITEILEKRVLKKSKAIITICNPLTEYFKKKWNIKNILTVNNGYDLDDFTYLEYKTDKVSRNNKIKIAHFGNLNASRASNRENLFIAIKNLKVSLILNSSNFELSFFGKLTVDEHKLIDSYKLDDIIMAYSSVEKKTGFQIILDDYDYLLLYGVAGHTSVVSSKLPEYLKLGKPILGICKGNEAEKIIIKSKTGEVSDFDSLSIENLFFKAIKDDITYYPDIVEISKYDRKYQTNILAQYLKSLIAEQ
jgi:hypothetical protein